MTIKNILFIFILALTVRSGYALLFVEGNNLILEDQMMYIQIGKAMAETGDFLQTTSGGYITVTERLPGYPALIALVYTLFGESNMAVVAAQILIDSFTCVIIALIVESVVTGGLLVAGIVSALNLGMIILSGMILTDTLFLFLFSIFILFLLKYLRQPTSLHMLVAISFLCIATLARPVSYYLVLALLPLLMVFFVWKKIPFKQAMYTLLLYIIPIVIVFGSMHYRNYTEYNSFSLTNQGGGHTLHWVVPAAYQYSGQGSYQEGQLLAKDYLEDSMRRDKFKMSTTNPFENSAYKMQVAKEVLIDLGLLNILHAWSAATVVNLLSPSIAYAPVARSMKHPSFYETPGDGAINKLFNYVTNTDSFLYLSIITIGTIFSIVFLIISIFGFYRMIKFEWLIGNNKEILLFLLFIIIYFIAITGPIVGVKYRLPMESIMTIFFSYALVKYGNKRTSNE